MIITEASLHWNEQNSFWGVDQFHHNWSISGIVVNHSSNFDNQEIRSTSQNHTQNVMEKEKSSTWKIITILIDWTVIKDSSD